MYVKNIQHTNVSVRQDDESASLPSSADDNAPPSVLLGAVEDSETGGGGSSLMDHLRRFQPSAEQIRNDVREGRVHAVPGGTKDGIKVDWCHRMTALFDLLFHNFCCAGGGSEQRSTGDWIGAFLPCWMWLRTYRGKSNLWRDAVAGLTVGTMVIPQGMSYAKLAGLPVQYGLYSALVPLYAYAIFGSSRHLSVGPVSITSLLLSTTLANVMAEKGIPADDPSYEAVYVQLAIQMSFLVAVLYTGLALLRLGFITLLLSHAVISGFMSGSAIIIAFSQIKYIFGYNIPHSETIYQVIKNLLDNISKFSYKTFLLGMGSLAVLIGFKKIGTRHNELWFLRTIGPLTVSVAGIILVAAFNLQNRGIPIVGTIPQGLPPVTVSMWFPIENSATLWSGVITVALVGLMESISIAKHLARTHLYKINAGMELYGLGMSNFAAALFSGYPITGSFSRSAVNNEAGAQSQLSSAIAATLVGLVLLLLTSVFELLPMCIVGGIIISGVMSLVDYAEAIRLWKFDKLDFCVWAVTFVGVMFLGAQLGLLCGAMLSFVMVLLQLALPRTHVLGRLPGSDAYRNIRQYPDGQSYPGCIVAGTDSPLCFLNAEVVKDKILRRAAEMDAETGVFTKYIVLDLTSSSDIDTCALHELDDWLLELNGGEEVSGAGTRQLCIVNPNSKVMRRMDQWGFVDALGREYCFCTVHDAVMWCLARLEEDEAERWEETGSCKIPDDGAASGTEGGRATSLVVVTASLSPDFDGGKESGTQGCAVNISTLEDGLHHRKPVIT